MRSSARAHREIGGGSSRTWPGAASRDRDSEGYTTHPSASQRAWRTVSGTRIGMAMLPMPREARTEPYVSAKYRERTTELHVIPRSPLLVRLPVASFTVVMATGIVSVAASDASLGDLASVLRWAALAMLGVLVSFYGAGVIVHRRVRSSEFGHPITVFDAFSLVAAVAVTAVALGVQLSGWALVVIWGGVVVLWLIIAALTLRALVRDGGSDVVGYASGRWLLAVVSIESIAVLGTAVSVATGSAVALGAALIAWAAGEVAYPVVAFVIAMRLHRRGWHSMDVTPDHWILMGALAICTLAATDLAVPSPVVIPGLRAGIATAAWLTWIGAGTLYPLLAVTSFRRLIVWRVTRQSDIRWWAVVFPLGMYAACTFGLFHLTHVDALRVLASAIFWPALAAWVLAGLMSLRTMVRSFTLERR
jgi:tellurite resistance protein TehA-like permease